jgi:general secretion pathway protein K
VPCINTVALDRQRGVALAIVVWFIAGMSLLVAGLVSHARVDTQMAQLHVARAKVSAAGDGAILLMMADVATGKVSAAGGQIITSKTYRLGDLDVVVSLVPTAGLVNLNWASPKVLAALFQIAGQISESEAKSAANNVIKWRSSNAGGGPLRFASVEDLLRVDGVTRTMLDAVRDYIMVGKSSSRATDWSVSPKSILAVMQKADPQKAQSLMRRRGRQVSSALAGSGADEARATKAGDSYRADAVVHYGDKSWLRRRWVARGSRDTSMLPWGMTRTEAPRVIQGSLNSR